jgi:hypothetical protein
LVLASISSCGSSPASSDTRRDDLRSLPRLGEERNVVLRSLESRKIPFDSPLTFYRFTANADPVRLSLGFAEKRDGTTILSQMNFRADNIEFHDHQTMSEDAKKRILDAVAPDRLVVRTSSFPAVVRYDVEELKSGESAMFVTSRAATQRLVQTRYFDFDSKQWKNGKCKRVQPQVLEIHAVRADSGVETMMINSEYLWHCLLRSIE